MGESLPETVTPEQFLSAAQHYKAREQQKWICRQPSVKVKFEQYFVRCADHLEGISFENVAKQHLWA